MNGKVNASAALPTGNSKQNLLELDGSQNKPGKSGEEKIISAGVRSMDH